MCNRWLCVCKLITCAAWSQWKQSAWLFFFQSRRFLTKLDWNFFSNVFIFLMWWTLLLSTPSHMVNVLIIAIVYLYFVFILRFFLLFFVKLFSVLKWFCCEDEELFRNENEWLDAFKVDRHWRAMSVVKTCDWLLLFHIISILAMHKIQFHLNRKCFENKMHANAKYQIDESHSNDWKLMLKFVHVNHIRAWFQWLQILFFFNLAALPNISPSSFSFHVWCCFIDQQFNF